MDSKDSRARQYIAERAELLGAIRLPNNAFKANAGTDVVSDILFLQKRDRPLEIEPAWTKLGENADGFAINKYFVDHPEMILGRQSSESTQYGKQDFTVEPIEGLELADQLHDAVKYIRGTYQEAAIPELGEDASIQETIPADPDVKNYSYTVVRGEVYYRENSVMVKPNLNATAKERVKGMAALRDCVQKLIGQQMDSFVSDETIQQTQRDLNRLYDSFTGKYGLINSRANSLAFSDDSSYYLLCSLEILNENRELERKADIFTKRTIKPHEVVTSVDTASEALALSISEKACVDMEYMAQLSGKSQEDLIDELNGVIFFDPVEREWQTADEYLSGNVREKLRIAHSYAAPGFPKDGPADYSVNVAALEQAQPKDLDASEIEVRLGATWINQDYIQQFMEQTFKPPYSRRNPIQVSYSPSTAEWNISGKSVPSTQDVNAFMTYGTERANAYTHSHYGKWLGNRAKISHRELARIAIDDALAKHPHTFEAFLDLLQQTGYTVRRGKHLTLCKDGQKNIRFDSLKKEYTEEEIRAVITGKKQRQPRRQTPVPAQQNVQKILDMAAIHAANKGYAYERWATNFNTKAASKSLLYLQTVCGGRYDVLTQKADEAAAHCRELLDQMNAAQKRLTEIDVLRRHVLNYARTREVFQQYKASGYSKKFLNEHQQEIDRHRAAKRAFNELGLQRLPSKKSLDMEYSQLLAKKKETYAAYRDAREQAQELLTHRENLRPYLAPQEASPRAKRLEQDER